MSTSLADPALHLALAGPALLVMLTAPLCWLVAPWFRWMVTGQPLCSAPLYATGSVPARLARLAAGAAIAALALATTAASVVAVAAPAWLVEAAGTVPLVLFNLGALATGTTAACAALAWRHRWWNLAHRVHFSAVAAALATVVAVASCYRLVGWPWVG